MQLFLGKNLKILEESFRNLLERTAVIGQKAMIFSLKPYLQTILKQESIPSNWDDITILTGEIMDETDYLDELEKSGNQSLKVLIYMVKAELAEKFEYFDVVEPLYSWIEKNGRSCWIKSTDHTSTNTKLKFHEQLDQESRLQRKKSRRTIFSIDRHVIINRNCQLLTRFIQLYSSKYTIWQSQVLKLRIALQFALAKTYRKLTEVTFVTIYFGVLLLTRTTTEIGDIKNFSIHESTTGNWSTHGFSVENKLTYKKAISNSRNTLRLDMKNSEEDLCVICHEPLMKETIGAVVPCGHVFHQTCFGEWTQARQSPWQQTQLQCPICNGFCSHETPFIRLYFNSGTKFHCQSHDFNDEDDQKNFNDQSNLFVSTKMQDTAYLFENRQKKIIQSLEGRIYRLKKVKMSLVEKEQQLNNKNIDMNLRRKDLISSIQIGRNKHDTALSELKKSTLALHNSKENLIRSKEEAKALLTCSSRKFQKAQEEAEASYIALMKKTQQVEEVSQRLRNILAKDTPKQTFRKKKGH
jgi:hypothetical protein